MSDQKITAIVPRTFDEVIALSKTFAVSTLVPAALRNKPGDVAIIIMTGAELGLGPMTSLRGVEVVQGKATLKPELMSALVKPSPECEYIQVIKCDDNVCTLRTKRRGTPEPEEFTYTMADAKRAGLSTKDNYNKNPADMLFARCLSRLCRRVYPDKTFNTYAPGELSEDEAPDTKQEHVSAIAEQIKAKMSNVVEGVVVKEEVVDAPIQDSIGEKIEAATTYEELRACLEDIKAQAGTPRFETLKDQYGQKKEKEGWE